MAGAEFQFLFPQVQGGTMWARPENSHFLTSSQVKMMLLVWGPDCENQWLRESSQETFKNGNLIDLLLQLIYLGLKLYSQYDNLQMYFEICWNYFETSNTQGLSERSKGILAKRTMRWWEQMRCCGQINSHCWVGRGSEHQIN